MPRLARLGMLRAHERSQNVVRTLTDWANISAPRRYAKYLGYLAMMHAVVENCFNMKSGKYINVWIETHVQMTIPTLVFSLTKEPKMNHVLVHL